jgi:hypothetical protein
MRTTKSAKRKTILQVIKTLMFLAILLPGCQSSGKTGEIEEKHAKDSRRSMLEYYTTQGKITNPGEYIYLYKDLPSDIEKLVEIVQGTMIHIFHAHRHGIKLSKEREKEVQLRKVEKMLERIIELDSRPITQARTPEKRLVGNCRDHSVLLCSLLRYKGIPARARCGFASYFPSGNKLTHIDHWICEYWNSDESRWIQADAQIDRLQKKAFKLEFNTLDMPKGNFCRAVKYGNYVKQKYLTRICAVFLT